MESTAYDLLRRGAEHERELRFGQALACYEEGLDILVKLVKNTEDPSKRSKLSQTTCKWMDQAEKVKAYVQKIKQAKQNHQQICISENAINYSYERVFGPYLDDQVTVVEVEDPYIRNGHQILNFLRFCELLVKKCKNLQHITLTTGEETAQTVIHQKQHLSQVAESLSRFNIRLDILYSSSLHDREIRLNNGWIIKIGRGLDYFKSEAKFSIGYCDYDLRKCFETTIDIFHKDVIKRGNVPTTP